LFYGLGSVAFGVKDNGFQTLVLLFYNQVVGLPPQLVGFAVGAALVCDAFIDPAVGQISDNWRSVWGRRHPFMYLAALPVAVSYLLLWNPPHWSNRALFVYLVVVCIVIRTFITFYEIPSSALAAELTQDYDQRTVLLSFRSFFAWAGGLGMAIVTYLVFLRPDAAHPKGQLNPAGYSHYGVAAAIVMFSVIIVSAAGTHRFIPRFHVPPQRHVRFAVLLREMFASLSHPSFLMLTLAGVFFYSATGLVFALNQYFYTYLWQLSAQQIAWYLVLGILAAAFAFAFALPLSRRFGKKWSAIVLLAAGLLIGIAPISLRLLALFPENGSPLLMPCLLGINTLSLALAIAAAILLASMLTDIVEDSQLATGRRSEGVFFAANSFMQKVLSGMGLFLSGMLLAAVHFPDHAVPGHVDAQIVRHLATNYIFAVIALYGIALVFIAFYRISREDHEQNLRKLAEGAALASPTIGSEAAFLEQMPSMPASKISS
jgi:Na+/melibiose symporter-like transporter